MMNTILHCENEAKFVQYFRIGYHSFCKIIFKHLSTQKQVIATVREQRKFLLNTRTSEEVPALTKKKIKEISRAIKFRRQGGGGPGEGGGDENLAINLLWPYT